MRPAFALKIFGETYVKDRMLNSPHESLVSIPLYAKLAGISVSEVEIEFATIRLKPEYNTREFIQTKLLKETLNPMKKDEVAMAPSESTRDRDSYKLSSWVVSEQKHFEE